MKAITGVVGLGKLGLPIAVTLALRGHEVVAYDVDPRRMSLDALSRYELGPDGTKRLIDCVDESLPLHFVDLQKTVTGSDCVFVVVETPHEPLFEGVTPLPDARADFGYDALTNAVRSVSELARPGTEIGMMSTVLPGTIRTRILPLVRGHDLVYCPQFVGMGAVARDVCRPEFTLLGRELTGFSVVREVLSGLGEARVFEVAYETAELAKMVYNTFVSAKVAFSNVVQRMAHEIGASATDVFDVIRTADSRLISDAYLGPGMGDGGPCHPRDNIALSWLARNVGMGSDFFSAVMETRQSYVEWLADTFVRLADGLPLVILGTAFKPGTDIETGSSSVLLATLLRLRQLTVTTVCHGDALARSDVLSEPAAYFVGSPDPAFVALDFPAGSVVVDPWQRVPDRPGITVRRIGEP